MNGRRHSAGHRFHSDWTGWLSALVLLGTVALLVWEQGGQSGQPLGFLRVLLPGTFVALLVSKARSAGRAQVWRSFCDGLPVLLPFVFLCTLLVIQCLNPSHHFDEVTLFLEPLSHRTWLPASTDSGYCWSAFSWFLVCSAAYGMARLGPGLKGRGALVLFTGLAVIASLHAVEAISQRITPIPFPVYPFTGRFTYENHYAAFTNLLIPITFTLGFIVHRDAAERNARSHPGWLLYGAGFLMVVSVLFSESRAGIAVTALLCVSLFARFLVFLQHRSRSGRSRQKWMFSLIALFGGGLLLWIGRGPLLGELQTLSRLGGEVGHRGLMYGSMLDMWEGREWFGIGFGCFSITYPFFQPEELQGYFRHAHFDGLELLMELGIIGALVFLGMLLGIGRQIRKAMLLQSGPERLLTFAAVISVVGMAVHSCIDFVFHLPVNALLSSVLLGLASSGVPSRHADLSPTGACSE